MGERWKWTWRHLLSAPRCHTRVSAREAVLSVVCTSRMHVVMAVSPSSFTCGDDMKFCRRVR